MKKIFAALTVLSLSVLAVQAQSTKEPLSFAGGLNLGLPVGDFHLSHSFGVGVHVQAEYSLADQVTGVATVGYTSFFGKKIDDGFGDTYKVPSVGLIPILVGARYYPAEQFFVGVQLGLGVLTGSSSSTSGFDFYPQVGYDADSYQVILGYNNLSASGGSLGNLALTGVFKFGGSR